MLCRVDKATVDDIAGRSAVFIRSSFRKREERVRTALDELVKEGAVKYVEKDMYMLTPDSKEALGSGGLVSAKRS